jgi:hypothetical protein
MSKEPNNVTTILRTTTLDETVFFVAALEHRQVIAVNGCVGAFLVKTEAAMVAYHLPVMVEVLDKGERAFNGICSNCQAVEDRCG